MKIAIMQPTYNPWVGYFDLIDKVDLFVYLDNVQLVKRSWQVRNRIKTKNGELFLTIPIKKLKSRNETLIKDAIIDDEIWRKKHLNSIKTNYKNSKFFQNVYPFIEELIYYNTQFLGEFNINFIEKIKNKIGIKTKTIKSSKFHFMGKKDELLVNICKSLSAKTYLSAQGSAIYIEKTTPGGEFEKNNVELYYHNYKHPVYTQSYGNFLPYMGIVDLLFNEGFENSLKIIRSGKKEDFHYEYFRKIIL